MKETLENILENAIGKKLRRDDVQVSKPTPKPVPKPPMK